MLSSENIQKRGGKSAHLPIIHSRFFRHEFVYTESALFTRSISTISQVCTYINSHLGACIPPRRLAPQTRDFLCRFRQFAARDTREYPYKRRRDHSLTSYVRRLPQ